MRRRWIGPGGRLGGALGRRLGRAGFTLVEVLLVSAVVSIVARIAIPNVNHVVNRARAIEIMAEIVAIRQAAYEYQARHMILPPDAGPGEVPEGLAEFLGQGFAFTGRGYTLDWESWVLPDGLPSDPDATSLSGVTVVPDSESLENALLGLVGPSGWFSLGHSYTFIVAR